MYSADRAFATRRLFFRPALLTYTLIGKRCDLSNALTVACVLKTHLQNAETAAAIRSENRNFAHLQTHRAATRRRTERFAEQAGRSADCALAIVIYFLPLSPLLRRLAEICNLIMQV